MFRAVLWSVCGVACLGLCAAAMAEDKKDGDEPKKSDAPAKEAAGEKSGEKLDQEALEKKFSEQMKNSVLVGRFTIDGAPADKLAAEERYEIESVTKLRGDYWTFLARMKYGTTDVKIPVTVKILWAGDTPMISMTDFSIPGLGTFTSRVLFYDNRYVGTWQHGKVGGHMFGSIEKSKPAEKEPPKPENKKAESK
ncbi:MAG: hypothetical protein IT428_04940 [Planctomycetaceae bacterium]|nr:hypothetical protein [Planctomycetaceae bacterium]